jgi:hypothetical protein
VTKAGVTLTAGKHVLKFVMDVGDVNLDYINITATVK